MCTALLLTVGIVAAVIQAVTGSGFALVAAPLVVLVAPNLLPGPLLTITTVLMIISVATSKRANLRKDARLLLPAGVGIIVGTLVSVPFLAWIGEHQKAVNVVVALGVIVALLPPLLGRVITTSPTRMGVGGFVAGTMTATVALPGPPLLMVYQAPDARRYREGLAVMFLVASVCGLVVLAPDGWDGIGTFVVGIVIGSVLGVVLARRAPMGLVTMLGRVGAFLRQGLLRGDYPLNRALPSSRQLAEQLGVSRTTVQTALERLVDDRLITAKPRSGMYPATAPTLPPPAPGRAAADDPGTTPAASCVDWDELFYRDAPPVTRIVVPDQRRYPFPFMSGQVEENTFPTRSWLKAVNAAMSGRNLHVALGDPREGDDPMLVNALIEEVLAPRGLRAGPDEVMITAGTQQSLSLLSLALLGPGVRVAFENPGYVDAYQVFAASGARMQHMRVDREGAVAHDAAGAHLVYLTPSSHHPTSVALSPERRRRFLALAESSDAVVVEDDYDAEIRLQGPPLAPMKSIDRSGRVVYLGTFSKYLAPGLRMGYVVAAPELIAALRRFRHFSTKTPSPMLQRSLALFVRSGDYARQLRSYRLRVRSKYEQFREAVGTYLPDMAGQLVVPQMNMWMHDPQGADTADWSVRARGRGVLVSPGELYYAPGAVVRRDEVRVGLASIPEVRIATGVRELAAARGGLR